MMTWHRIQFQWKEGNVEKSHVPVVSESSSIQFLLFQMNQPDPFLSKKKLLVASLPDFVLLIDKHPLIKTKLLSDESSSHLMISK